MIRNKVTNVPPYPTRRMRKERQNFMVRNGATRASTKKMRTYDDFVDAYCQLIDDVIDPNVKAMLTPDFTTALLNAIDCGDIGLTTDFGNLLAPPTVGQTSTALLYAEKHYLHVKDVKTGEIVDPAYEQFIKPIKDQFNGG